LDLRESSSGFDLEFAGVDSFNSGDNTIDDDSRIFNLGDDYSSALSGNSDDGKSDFFNKNFLLLVTNGNG